jgi:ABC-type bacteriocin/lantibiotic exporter with double-glycine peptidase domain
MSSYIVARHFGVQESLDEMACRLPVSAKGTSMKAIVELMQHHGLEAIGVEMSGAALSRLIRQSPAVKAILYVKPEHWMPLFEAADDTVEVYDYPSWRTEDMSIFLERYEGKAILVGPAGAVSAALSVWPLAGWLSGVHAAMTVLLVSLSITLWIKFVIRCPGSTSTHTVSPNPCRSET